MGRELKRKQAKREGKNVREVQKNNQDKPLEMKTFITIIVALILTFVILYILTGLFITKEIKWFDKKDNVTENKITNKILAKDSLRQYEEKYYVYYYDSSDEDSSVSSIVSNLDDKVYRVDLSDGFNSNFVSENSSGKVDNIDDLRVVSPSVLKIEVGKIVEFYSGVEEIKAALE